MRGSVFIHALLIAGCCWLAGLPAQAQAPQAPAPAAPQPTEAPVVPEAAPQAPAHPETQAPAAAPQPEAQQQPGAPETAAPAAADRHELSAEDARRLAAERWRVRAMLARARAERANERDEEEMQRQPVYGDAGAAFAFGLSLDKPFYLDSSFDAFKDDNVTTRFGLWLGYDVASLQENLILAAELGWGVESVDQNGLLGGALQSDLNVHTVFAGVQMRWVLLSMLQPYARLVGGPAFIDMELHSNQTFSDSDISPVGSLGAGVLLRTPTRLFENRRGRGASLSFGVMVEGGYTLAAPVALKLDGNGPDERDIALTEADLGELDRSGPYVRVSVVMRY